MKTLSIKVLSVVLFFVIFSGFSFAGSNDFVIGVENLDYMPYYTNSGGKYKGFAREILDAFGKEKGYKFNYKILSVKRLFSEFINKKVDFRFPDNPYWKGSEKKGYKIVYSEPVVGFIDGVMVSPGRKGKGVDSLKRLGVVMGFTPWDYLGLIKSKKVKATENSSFTGLIKQCIVGRVDGIYMNPVVCNYQLSKVLKKPNALVFDPGLPHTKSSYLFSTQKYPEVIKELNKFLVDRKQLVKSIKKKFKVNVSNN